MGKRRREHEEAFAASQTLWEAIGARWAELPAEVRGTVQTNRLGKSAASANTAATRVESELRSRASD